MQQFHSSIRRSRLQGLFLLGVVAALGTGCSKAPITGPDQRTLDNPSVGSESVMDSTIAWNTIASVWVNKGETKTVSGGRYQMQFVRASLAQGAQITIAERDPMACDVVVGPSGMAVGKGTTLVVSYAGTTLELSTYPLNLYRLNDSTGSWELVSATNDAAGRKITAKVSVLGRYMVSTQPPGKAGW